LDLFHEFLYVSGSSEIDAQAQNRMADPETDAIAFFTAPPFYYRIFEPSLRKYCLET
jgi:hypothetical protein